jgi:hypothetical protein
MIWKMYVLSALLWIIGLSILFFYDPVVGAGVFICARANNVSRSARWREKGIEI